MFSMETQKFCAPKFSFALKDLADYLGIFELSEEELRSRRIDYSDSSSNISYVTSSAFKPNMQLDIIAENDDKVEGESEQETQNEDEKSNEGDSVE